MDACTTVYESAWHGRVGGLKCTRERETGVAEELFGKYVGCKKEFEELISAIQVQRMSVTLDREEPVPKDGDPVPLGWLGKEAFAVFA